jgi:hypothetical protein
MKPPEMIKLQLPFEYTEVPCDMEAKELILKSFGMECRNIEKFEVTQLVDELGFYKCKPTAVVPSSHFREFTLVGPGNFQIMSLDIDGEVDGVYMEFIEQSESLISSYRTSIIIQNHPCLVLKVENARIWTISCELVETPLDVSSLIPFIDFSHMNESAIENYSSLFVEASALTIEHFSKFQLNVGQVFRVGPADYRSFFVERDANAMCKIFANVTFIKYLSEITKLPLGLPLTPPFSRILSSAGDYQILHGNYSESTGLDCIFTFYPGKNDGFEWKDEVCGHIHYLDEDGSEIFKVPNSSNSLTIVYRNGGVVRFLENIKGTKNLELVQVLATFPVLE